MANERSPFSQQADHALTWERPCRGVECVRVAKGSEGRSLRGGHGKGSFSPHAGQKCDREIKREGPVFRSGAVAPESMPLTNARVAPSDRRPELLQFPLVAALMLPPQDPYAQRRRPTKQTPVRDHHQVVMHIYVLLVFRMGNADTEVSIRCLLLQPLLEPL